MISTGGHSQTGGRLPHAPRGISLYLLCETHMHVASATRILAESGFASISHQSRRVARHLRPDPLVGDDAPQRQFPSPPQSDGLAVGRARDRRIPGGLTRASSPRPCPGP